MPRVPFAVALLAVASFSLSAVAEEKTSEVKVKDLTLNVPQTWEQSKPSSNLRLAQFDIPTAKGDKEETQLVIYSFAGGGGGVDANVGRWTGEFENGKEITLKKGKSPQGEYVLVDISGGHLGTSFSRRPKALADGRLLGAILTIEGKGVYYLKMVGQAKTVEAAAKAFRTAIGADAEKETEYKPST